MTTASLQSSHPNTVHTLWVIARKEIHQAFRNRLFVTALVMLLALSLVAISLGAATVHTRIADYEQAAQVLRDLGRTNIPPMAALNPIAVSKNFVNYLAMVGALLAMILGFTSIDRERKAGTLRLILSRPVYRDQLLTGKVLGNALLLAVLMVAVGLVTVLALRFIGSLSLTADQMIKLMLTMGMSWLYTLIFFLLAMFLALRVPNGNQALLLTVIVWLVFAFIFPQIGDTMDLDNQLPGGFFASIGVSPDQEHKALERFRWYESVRDGVEELSPTKHYERISFALLGVKTEFANTPWNEVIQLKMIDLVGLIVPIIVLLGASYVVFLRQEQ